MDNTLLQDPYNEPTDLGLDPYEAVKPRGTGSDAMDNIIAYKLGLLQSDSHPDGAVGATLDNHDLVKASSPEEIDGYVRQAVNTAVQERKQRILDADTREYARTHNEAVITAAVKRQNALDNIGKEPDPQTALEKMVRFRINAGDSEVAKENIAISIKQGMIYKAMQDHGMDRLFQAATEGSVLDKVSQYGRMAEGFLGSLIPGKATVEAALTGKGPLKAQRDFENEVFQFAQLSREDQVLELPKVLEKIAAETHSNPTQFLGKAHYFLHPEDIKWSRSEYPLDILNAAPLLPSILKSYRAIAGSNTAMKFAKDLGELDQAAKMTAAAASDPEIAKKMGTTQEAALKSVSPFQGGGFDPAVLNGVAAKSQKAIHDTVTKVSKILDTTKDAIIDRTVFKPEQTQAAQQKLITELTTPNKNGFQFANNAEVVKEDGHGFWLKVSVMPSEDAVSGANALRKRAQDIEDALDTNSINLGLLYKEVGGKTIKDPRITSLKNERYALLKERNKVSTNLTRAEQGLGPVEQEHYIRYTTDDMGRQSSVEFSRGFKDVNSPTVVIHQLSKGAVNDATLAEFTGGAIKAVLHNAGYEAIKRVPKKVRRSVDAILLQMDREGRVPTAEELYQGIKTPTGLHKLDTEEGVAAFYASRAIFDKLHSLEQVRVRKSLQLDGYKHVTIPIGDESVNYFVRPESSRKTMPENVTRIYDFGVGRVIEVADPSVINARLESGDWKLMKSKTPIEMPGAGKDTEILDWVLAKDSHVQDITDQTQVLKYRQGYVTKNIKDVNFIAEAVRPKLVNGIMDANHRSVIRYFGSKSEADAFALSMNAKGEKVEITSAKQNMLLKQSDKDRWEHQTYGGLYSGQRADMEIPYGTQGLPGERMGAFEAMENYMNHVSVAIPTTELRLKWINEFMNSAKYTDAGGVERSYLEQSWNWRSRITGLNETDPKYLGMKAQQRWIEDQLHIASTEERNWENMMQRLGNWMDSKTLPKVLGGKALPKQAGLWSMRMGNKNVWADMRSVTFNAFLGWANITQLWTQMQSLVTMAAIDPSNFAVNGPRAIALRAAMLSENPQVWRKFGVAMGMSGDEAEHFIAAYRKTGMHQHTRSTADYAASMRLHTGPVDIRHLADQAQLFYRLGEQQVRLTAFTMAVKKLEKANPLILKRGLTDAEIDAATVDSLRLMTNLSRANRAQWQKGFVGMVTQFKQTPAKFMEQLWFPSGAIENPWTKAEKQRVLVGQFIMYGAAGIPFLPTILNAYERYAKDDGEVGLGIKNPKVVRALSGGLNDYIMTTIFGEPVTSSTRLATLPNMEDLMDSIMQMDKITVKDFMGAFGTEADRVFKVSGRAAAWLRPDVITGTDGRSILTALNILGEVTSTWTNAEKYKLSERLGYLATKDGKVMFDDLQYNTAQQALAYMFGLTPTAVADAQKQKKFSQDVEADAERVADAIYKANMERMNLRNEFTEQNAQDLLTVSQVLMNSLPTDAMRAKAVEKLNKKYKNNDNQGRKILLDALQHLAEVEGNTTGYSGNIELNSSLTEGAPSEE